MTSVWRVVTLVKERRTYLIKATSMEAAEELALDHHETPDKVELIDEFVRDTHEVAREKPVAP